MKAFGDFLVLRDYKGQLYSHGGGLPKGSLASPVRSDGKLRRIVLRDERKKRPFIEDFAVGERHVLAVDGSRGSSSQPAGVRLGILSRRRTGW